MEKKEEKVFYYHSEASDNFKKSRYTISGQFDENNKSLKLAYSKRSYPDNFSKQIGRNVSRERLLDNDKNYSITLSGITEFTTKEFIKRAKEYVYLLKHPKK